ncbi:hypothetical protein [Flavobacterium sp.]|uniref:hypothetical protein n=1 Tax=Flavobacterium sp. TaxID=239 RepID=UPI00286BE752|nr:hypothetical protein [Flavobacterium sp.]
MKKKLEADLISIAHRILQLKNKSDVNQLYIETQKLAEKLSVLRFVEEHFADAKPTIGRAEVENKIEAIFENKEVLFSEAILEVSEEIVPIVKEEVTVLEKVVAFEIEEEPVANQESISDGLNFTPAFELEEEVETPIKTEAVQISFEDLLGGNYNETLFVKVQQVENIPTAIAIEIPTVDLSETISQTTVAVDTIDPIMVSLDEKLSNGLSIGLNDRIGFVKHLFANSDEDFNRVLNQLITYDSFEEANDFIEDMVKPDYNNWEEKEDYAKRFMEIVEKKFE